MNANRILVTGAAGFIGSRVIAKLAREQFSCFGIDNLETGCPPLTATDNLDFRIQDICDPKGLTRIFEEARPDVVVHLAAMHHIPTCERNPSKALYVNVVGTQNVLQAAAQAGSRRIVLASTGGVYDWIEGALTEEMPVRPTDIYTLSKATNERQLTLWVEGTDRTGIIARIFNTIGQNDRNAHLIPDILCQLKSNGHHPVVRLGNQHTRRDYIHVEDTAACIVTMVQADYSRGIATFNVGTGKEHSVRTIVECIAGIRNRHVEYQSDPSRIRRVDRSSQLADVTKTRSELGWVARLNLEEALRLTVGEED